MKKALRTVSLLVLGGLAGREVERRWSDGARWAKEAKAAQPGDQVRPTVIMQYGFPGNTNLKVRENYVLSYDRRTRNPHWVFEHLTKDLVQKTEDSADRENIGFVEDQSIPKLFRATNRDFHGSGFDRGHLAAAANHRAQKRWMEETFLLSNISPQHPDLNREAWNNLEKYVRSLAFHNDNVYVCTGPLFLPMRMSDGKSYVTYQVLEPNHVAVPTHFFKVVLTETKGHYELRSYVMPNHEIDAKIPLKNWEQPIEAIEKSSGLRLFDELPPKVAKGIVQQQARRLRTF